VKCKKEVPLLAKIQATGCPPYEIIVNTARSVFAHRGTFSYTKDEKLNLIEEAITAALSEYAAAPMSSAELVTRTKSICRKIIRREKSEYKNAKGKRDTLDSIVHQKLVRNEETGDEDWYSPLDNYGCDPFGAKIGHLSPNGGSRNIAEDRMIEYIHAERVAAKLDHEDALFIIDYFNRRGQGRAISDADRQRFHRLRQMVRERFPEDEQSIQSTDE
jgi:hypothetical protein